MKILTPQNYYEEDEYMSVSAFKKLKKCEVDGTEDFETTESMLVGSYVDSYVEGTLEQFRNEHPEIFSSKGATKGELKANFKYADEICKFIVNDKRLMQFLSGEKQTIMTGQIAGVPFKIKMDSYIQHMLISDLKVMKSITNNRGEYIDFITPWGYDIQLACYQEIVRQNTGDKLPCYICAVTKESPINSAIVHIPQEYLDRALYSVEADIQRLYDVKTGKVPPVGCGKCDACISKRLQTPLISLNDLMIV